MKKYVYIIKNNNNQIEYIGETKNPKHRLKCHKNNKKSIFYKRHDISMHILKEFDNAKDAFNYQCKIQKQYGFITDAEKYANQNTNIKHVSKAGKISIKSKKHISKKYFTCQYCGCNSNGVGYFRWHGDNCKHKV